VIDTPKSKGSIRVIPLSQEVAQLLVTLQTQSNAKPEDFILAGRMGVPGDHAGMLRDHVKPACQALGLKPATWLTFQRSWNTWADGQGISPKIRGAIVGNSEEINSRIYTKTIPDTLRRAVESVSEVLYAATGMCANCAQRLPSGE